MRHCWRSVFFCFRNVSRTSKRHWMMKDVTSIVIKWRNQGDSYRLFFEFWNLIICQLFPIDWMAPFKVRNLSCFYLKWVQLFRASFVEPCDRPEVTAWHEWRQRKQRLRDQTLARIQRANAETMGEDYFGKSGWRKGNKNLHKFNESRLHWIS